MNRRWIQRGLSLLTIWALALGMTGVAEAPEGADLYGAKTFVGTAPDDVLWTDGPIYAEAVEQSAEQGELDLDGLLEADAVETTVPDAMPSDTPTPTPEITSEPSAEPEQTIEETPVPETTVEPSPEATQEAPETAEISETATPEATEAPEPSPTPEVTEAPQAEPTPEATEVPQAEPTPEDTPVPETAAIPTDVSEPEADETTPDETDEAAKAALEAAATLAFPIASLRMGKGEKLQFAAVLGDGSAPAQVTYKSSKPKIVKVDGAGNLWGRKKGIATITATLPDGTKATCKVRVVKAPSKVRLSAKKLVFGVEETRKLNAKLNAGSSSVITWTSSDPAVAEVDSAGNLRGVAPGTVTVTARTFNGKKASCTVTILNGRTPTSLTFPSKTITLGLQEVRLLTPQLGEGEAAQFTFTSSKKKVVSVTPGGWLSAKKKGTAKITVKTHNGLKYTLTVKVTKAPAKITLSKANIALEVGKSTTLKATLPSGTSSAVTWSSSNPAAATVDDAGNVQAVAEGTAEISVSTFNGKAAVCTVVVTPINPDNVPPALTTAQMVANLRNSKSITSKRDAIANVAEVLMNAGFEPAFAAGVCANVYSEGTYGSFESSKYVKNYLKRPKYFCYLDGGDYYTLKDGQYVLTAVYLSQEEKDAYTGPAEARLRYGEEKYYWNHWSGKRVYNIDLNELQAFMDALTAGKWEGKFGLGITQWTGGRTRKLMAKYRKYAGEGSATITEAQVIAAENEMILYDLQGDYKKVYTGWRSENESALYCANAAKSAGSWVCLKYEIPANKETSAVTRGDRAAKFYQIMVGAD